MASHLTLLALFVTLYFASAYGQSPLQDFCVAKRDSSVLVNGFTCEDPKLAQADDFFFSGLQSAGNTSNSLGSKVTPVFVSQLPGLNTLGISMARLDIAPGGLNPPHIHPRATEILTIVEGCMEVGFVTSNPENRLISKVLEKGDVFVFPKGLVHFERNVGHGNAIGNAFLSSENPGFVIMGNWVFGSDPLIPGNLLAKAFQVDESIIYELESKF